MAKEKRYVKGKGAGIYPKPPLAQKRKEQEKWERRKKQRKKEQRKARKLYLQQLEQFQAEG